MPTANSFHFEGYRTSENRLTCYFDYRVVFDDAADMVFTETWVLPSPVPKDDLVVKKILDALAIGVGVSYYKRYLPNKFGLWQELSERQAEFWNDVYLNGFGELLYVNKLSASRLARFSGSATLDQPVPSLNLEDVALLGLGGGKDSIVAGELLKNVGMTVTGFVFSTDDHVGQTSQIAAIMDVALLPIHRTIDPLVIEIAKDPDTYSGHVPISMLFGLSGLLLAAIYHYRYVVVANESSASEINTKWEDIEVNHQWSKSLAFEKNFQAFVYQTISTDIWYFSAIRPLNSVAIAKMFSKYKDYFSSFTSCNLVFRIDKAKRPNGRWCGQCAKCLSSFIILSPWITEKELVQIFDKNMLDDDELKQLFLELTGATGHKPLDCVGTPEEIVLSLNLSVGSGKFLNTKLVKEALARSIVRGGDYSKDLDAKLRERSEDVFPPQISETISDKIDQNV